MSSYISFPIAIVGAACRLPGGVRSLDSLWSVLERGQDMVTQVPLTRWDTSRYLHPRRDMPGRTVSVSAGIVDDIYGFDPSFFGISRTEAEAMDPQQRLLLQLAWEAMEDAGIPPSTLWGSDTAVFVGAASPDGGTVHADDICATTPYSMTGTNLSIISNRISYIFNFHGPSMTIDTACSSSMHSLHQACMTLVAGGTGLAVAGGVNVLLAPYPFVGFSQAHMLSPGGRCKVFDASGDGYVRSEGGGLVLLQPLSEALAQGRRILGVIRGIGVNSDGRTQGIALPSAAAQEELLRGVYEAAGCDPARLAYVEAHGTGTAVGDPVETSAIGRALGQRRTDPLWVGSVKCNLGHLETASAMAGLMKSLLVLREGRIPPQIHLKNINPAIDCQGLNLRFPLKMETLPETGGLPLVGINSFGFGGSNGHLLLEAAERTPSERPCQVAVPPMFLSARSDESLKKLAAAYADRITAAPGDYYHLASGAVTRRDQLPRRLVAEGASPEEVASALRAAAAGSESGSAALSTGEAVATGTGEVRTAFVFSGNGGQWTGMGRAMMANEAFAARAREVADLMRPLSGKDLLELLEMATDEDMAHTDVAQQLLFLIQVGLCAALEQVGIRADAALGHSVGEVAAAWYCGAVSLEDAVRIIYYRSMHQESTAGAGRMAAASVSAAEAGDLCARYPGVEIAGVNAADAVTLSGDGEALARLGEELKSRHVFFKMLPLNYAFHSSRMDPIRQELLADLADLGICRPRLHFISAVTGREELGGTPASYWWENVRQSVNFHGAVQTALELGVRHFLEIGPHSILLRYLRSGLDKAACAQGGSLDGWVGGTLSRNSGAGQFDTAWRNAWIHGWPVDMSCHFPEPGAYIPLPTYPWNNEDCRLAPTPECQDLVTSAGDHPLLGRKLHSQNVWEQVVDLESSPWLGDHRVGDAVYYPAAAFLEMALAAAGKVSGSGEQVALCNTAILRPVILRERQPMVLRLTVSDTDGEIRILSRPYMRDEPWTLHARARMIHADLSPASLEDPAHPEKFGAVVGAEELYRLTRRANMGYGPVFRQVADCWQQDDEILARFLPSPEGAKPAWEEGMLVPPPLLDGGLQLIFALIPPAMMEECPAPRLPYWFSRCVLLRSGRPAFARLRRIRCSRDTVVIDLSLLDSKGCELLRLEGGRARTVEQLAAPRPLAYATKAVPRPHPGSPVPRGLPGNGSLARELREQAGELTSDSAWIRHRDEILPLREMAVLALARDFAAGDAGFRYPELAVRLQELAASRGKDVMESLPSFADVWCTLGADAPEDSALAMLLAAARRTLMENGEMIPAASHLWEELRRQEYRMDDCLCGLALRDLLREAEGPASILEIGATSSSLGRLMDGELRRHCRILAAGGENDLRQLRLALEGLDTAPADAPLEVVQWDPAVSSPQIRAHVAVAFHCLHLADDIPAALSRCREALRDDGVLILAESGPNITDDLIRGLDESWWVASQDGADTVSRLLEADEWRRALTQAGFGEIEEIRPDPAVPRFLLLARAASGAAAPATRDPGSAPSLWLLCAGDGTPDGIRQILDRLAVEAAARGDQVIRLAPGEQLLLEGTSWQCRTEDPEDWQAVWESLAARKSPVCCVDALALDAQGLDWQEAGRQSGALIQMARGWSRAGSPQAAVRVLTWGAMVCPGDTAGEIRPSQAPVLGAARVIMNEMPKLEISCVDLRLDPDGGAGAVAGSVLRELLERSAEREVILRGAERYVLRSGRTADRAAPDPRGGTLRLDCVSPGHLETLRWQSVPLAEPGAGQVRVAVRAVGLNFRDVMWAMNMLPEEALEGGFSGPGLGIECAGVVDAVGPGVTDVTPGERVLCFGPRCFSGHVVTTFQAVTPIPRDWTFAQAATVPVAFFTAWYSLRHLAQMEPGERLLIHGAAGGVGLAAVQIASCLDLEVYATAGNEDKRHMLRLMGVEHVYDSRSLSFHDQILADTGGEGVDAVLNSLAGEGMDQSLRLLRPFGRFLELGKRDFYADSPLRLRPFRNNVSFFGVDVDQLMRERPEKGQRIFREIMDLFADGQLRPLPCSVYAAGEAEHAFRAMQQSRHVGKIVVEPPKVNAGAAAPLTGTALPVSREGSYLVTGGLGGFGLATARRLAVMGAGALILMSRRGLTDESREAVAELATLGLPAGQRRSVVPVAQDVADEAGLGAALKEALKDLPPLKGVIHAAAVLDDGMVADMTPERLERVLRPKLGGAFSLHRCTLDQKLDFFVMYSSATTLLGNPGQVNYVAANMGLEGLAALRRSMGLPGLAVGWGAIGDVGMLTRDQKTLDSLIRVTGIAPLAAADALDALSRLPGGGDPAPALFIADWKRLSRLPAGRTPRFLPLRVEDEGGDTQEESLSSLVRTLPPEKALARITEIITATVARIMRVPASSVKTGTPLADMGMDSLMSVELMVALEERLEGRSLMGGLTAGSSIRDVAGRIISLLSGEDAGSGDLRSAMELSHNVNLSEDFASRVFKEAGERHE